jgi:hypothetical protein
VIGHGRRLLPRIIALAIPLAIVAALGFGVARPLLGGFEGDAQDLDRSRHLLDGYQRIAAERPALEQRLALLQQEEAASPGLWPGTTPALATTGLQGEVRRLIEAAGGQIRAVQELTPSAEGGFERIGLRCDLSLPMMALPGLVQAFDAHSPYLFLDKIDLHAPEAPTKSVPLLAIRWEVSGYRARGPT